ncbi:MAG: universal stress protein [Alphaproteobacteria bacterium]|nr:universal stress protein [Alphaproteobacteria bacterium]
MLKSVLVAIDGTDAALSGLALARRLAQRHGAKLTGLAVVDVPFITAPEATPIGGSYYKAHKDADLVKRADEQARTMLAVFDADCRRDGVASTALEREGDPYEHLLGLVDVHDLVVIGRDTSFHSVASDAVTATVNRLLKDNPRPIVVTPAASSVSDVTVVAYDGSIPSMRALQMLALLGIALSGQTHIVTVRDDERDASAIAQRAQAFLQLYGIAAEAHPIGTARHAADVLVERARDLKAGLLAMGAFGHRGWRELLLGSATSRLLDSAATALFVHH